MGLTWCGLPPPPFQVPGSGPVFTNSFNVKEIKKIVEGDQDVRVAFHKSSIMEHIERNILQPPSGASIFKIERLENGRLKTPTATEVDWLYAQDPPSEPSWDIP